MGESQGKRKEGEGKWMAPVMQHCWSEIFVDTVGKERRGMAATVISTVTLAVFVAPPTVAA